MGQTNKAGTGALSLAALGVVYGDIGTSPLYAFKEAFTGPQRADNQRTQCTGDPVGNVLGLNADHLDQIRVVMLKFDNDGEGGVLP